MSNDEYRTLNIEVCYTIVQHPPFDIRCSSDRYSTFPSSTFDVHPIDIRYSHFPFIIRCSSFDIHHSHPPFDIRHSQPSLHHSVFIRSIFDILPFDIRCSSFDIRHSPIRYSHDCYRLVIVIENVMFDHSVFKGE
jgi:hypothetical protein